MVFKDDLLEIKTSKTAYENAVNIYKSSRKLVDDCHKIMNSMIDVGTDVYSYSDNHS